MYFFLFSFPYDVKMKNSLSLFFEERTSQDWHAGKRLFLGTDYQSYINMALYSTVSSGSDFDCKGKILRHGAVYFQ
jgi:hypothetical protein